MKKLINEQFGLNLYLIGNPNCGKTRLFNSLTKKSSIVANYPGVTVGIRRGTFFLKGIGKQLIYDLPGTYSLIPKSVDEKITTKKMWDIILSKEKSLILFIVDIFNLSRSLYLLEQIKELSLDFIIIFTMSDKLSKKKLILNREILFKIYNVSVIVLSSISGYGFDKFFNTIEEYILHKRRSLSVCSDSSLIKLSQKKILKFWIDGGKLIAEHFNVDRVGNDIFYANLALFFIGSIGNQFKNFSNYKIQQWILIGKKKYSMIKIKIINDRYYKIDKLLRSTSKVFCSTQKIQNTDRIDSILLHPVFGSLLSFFIFILLLESLFFIPVPLIDFTLLLVVKFSNIIKNYLPSDSLLSSLFVNGFIVGIGNVISFVPLIAILFFLIHFLEESGYLARVTFLTERIMYKVGLPGRSLISFLSGFVCAVPAVMSTRIIKFRKQRFLTIMVVPFISCSARLPVYALLVSVFFSSVPSVFGLISSTAFIFFLLYSLGIVWILFSSFIFCCLFFKIKIQDFLIELPEYQLPNLYLLLKEVCSKILKFLKEVGTIILVMTIIMWGLFTFPIDKSNIQKKQFNTNMKTFENSYAGKLGKNLEPLFSPLGFNWRIGVCLISSFSAREVFVSTLSVAFSQNKKSLKEVLKFKKDEKTGKNIFTPLIVVSLLVFFALSMNCMSTLAVIKKETKSFLFPIVQFLYSSVLAWLNSFIVFQIGTFLGFS